MLITELQYPELFRISMLVILSFTMFFALTQREIPDTPILFGFIASIAMIYFLGMAPASDEIGLDRLTYEDMFLHSDIYLRDGFRDILFILYAKICYSLCGNSTGCFIISAALYVAAYLYFYKKACPKKYLYLFIIGSLAMGFTSYHYNVLRAGLAIACVLIAISKNQNKYISILFSCLAIGIHATTGLIVFGYIIANKFNNTKYYYLLWVTMLLLLFLGAFNSLSHILTPLTTVADNRFEGYLSGGVSEYQVGLRLDFIIYSLIAIIAGWYYLYLNRYKDSYYIKLYHTYLICNACWLVFNKIPFTDRIAYLSWFLIPIIVLYPLLSNNNIKHKKSILMAGSLIIVGIAMYI